MNSVAQNNGEAEAGHCLLCFIKGVVTFAQILVLSSVLQFLQQRESLLWFGDKSHMSTDHSRRNILGIFLGHNQCILIIYHTQGCMCYCRRKGGIRRDFSMKEFLISWGRSSDTNNTKQKLINIISKEILEPLHTVGTQMVQPPWETAWEMLKTLK